MKQLALLTNIPSPYRIPFFQELARLCDLHVVFDVKTEANRHWKAPEALSIQHRYARGFTWRYLRRRPDGIADDRREIHIRYGVFLELLRLRPDVIISAELGPRSLMAFLYAALTRTPLVLWSEGTLHTEGWVGHSKTKVRKFLVRHARRYWVNGVESAELMQLYGADPASIDSGMTGVDTRWFANEVASALPHRDQIRAAMQIRSTVFLFVGQLIQRKGITEFLQALHLLSQGTKDFSVVLAGEGDHRAAIEQWMVTHPECTVRLVGHVVPEQLVKIYAAADVFVLPTLDDNWSLATLEAAVAGLPQIYSKFNGAVSELRAQGVGGTVIDPFNALVFADALRTYIETPPSRLDRRIVDELVLYYSPKMFAERAMKSIEACAVK